MTLVRLIRFVAVAAMTLTLAACEGGNGDAPASAPSSPSPGALASSLSERMFGFSSGAVFHAALEDQKVDLVFADLAEGDGPFTLRSGDAVAGGTVTLGSCLLELEASTFPAGEGPQPGETIHLDPCVLDEGQLSVENSDTGVTARSTVSATFDRFGAGATWTTIQDTVQGPIGATYTSRLRLTYTVTGRRIYHGRELVEANSVVTEDGITHRATALLDPGTGIAVVILDELGMEVLHAESDLLLPLRVGDSWTEITVTYGGCATPEGGQEPCPVDSETTVTAYTVAGFEGITTPAGSFVTLRITASDGFTIYYDPVFRVVVKSAGTMVEDGYRLEAESVLVSYDW